MKNILILLSVLLCVTACTYTEEEAVKDYMEDCVPICHHPKHPKDTLECLCYCNEVSKNIREFHPKSYKDMNKALWNNDLELSDAQAHKCFGHKDLLDL